MPADEHKPGSNVSWRQSLTVVGLALGIPWMIALPVIAGWYIDKQYGTAPTWFLIGLALGLIGTAFDIYKILKRLGQFK